MHELTAKEAMMRQAVMVSKRGQVTLPAAIRKRLGVREGGMVIVETQDDTVTLRPAAVLEVEAYSDDDVAQWDSEDRLADSERKEILRRVKGA